MKTVTLLISVVLTSFLASCGEDIETLPTDSSAISKRNAGDLVFTLQVLNMEGEPQAVFQEGENFLLDFTIENKGENEVLICECDLPQAIDDFFAVYRVFEDDKGNPEKTLIGKPYDGIYGFFDLPVTGVKAKEKIEYRLSWIAIEGVAYPAPVNNMSATVDGFSLAEQEPLPLGNYMVAFPVEEYSIDTSFEVRFIVQ